jgi:hypothetical protein
MQTLWFVAKAIRFLQAGSANADDTGRLILPVIGKNTENDGKIPMPRPERPPAYAGVLETKEPSMEPFSTCHLSGAPGSRGRQTHVAQQVLA